jgi:branched-chain amino acid transport system ATP-binding protein
MAESDAGSLVTPAPPSSSGNLKVEGLSAGYQGMVVLHDVSVEVPDACFTALVGPNGSGKTTLLRAISGLIPTLSGSVSFGGHVLSGSTPETIVASGIALVPEGRHIFPNMSVRDNLSLGAYLPEARRRHDQTYEEVCELFPILKERSHQIGKTLSGGEAQMLAIGRALMSRPKVLMVDEPSLGLGPQIVTRLFRQLHDLPSRGVTVFAVEQNVRKILQIADAAYVLSQGRIVAQGKGKELLERPEIRKAFLGM